MILAIIDYAYPLRDMSPAQFAALTAGVFCLVLSVAKAVEERIWR